MAGKDTTRLTTMSLADVVDAIDQGRDQSDWKRVDKLTDKDIERAIADDPDAAPVLTDKFWNNARLIVRGADAEKATVTMRLDKDVLDIFKQEGPGYQSRMNAVLRAWAYSREKGESRY